MLLKRLFWKPTHCVRAYGLCKIKDVHDGQYKIEFLRNCYNDFFCCCSIEFQTTWVDFDDVICFPHKGLASEMFDLRDKIENIRRKK